MANWQPPSSFRDRPVAVLGGGVLGRRIAACWIAGGWDVNVRDPSAAQREQTEQYVSESIGDYTILTQHELGKLATFEDLTSAVQSAWLVFEAVPEKLNIKTSTFADLERLAPSDCIFGSNSSSFKSSEMLSEVRDDTKRRILNTHYMMPPQALVVELMTDGHTAPELVQFLMERHREAGLHPIVALKESTGFVFNRVWAAIKREVLKVLQEGVSTPDAVDQVFMEMYGSKQGPCRMMDKVGLDTVSFIEEHYVAERNLDRGHLDWLIDRYVKPGMLGVKTPQKGGLYTLPKPGSQTQLIFLNLGTAEPLGSKMSVQEVMHRGSILGFTLGASVRPTEILKHAYMPDGIDIAGGRMFWSDMGNVKANDGAIYSAFLDGTDVQTVVPPGQVHTPKQLICDEEGGKLYFCDREGGKVWRCDFKGSHLEILVQTGNYQERTLPEKEWCVGVAISRKLGKLFWTQKGPSKGNQGAILCAGLESPLDPTKRTDIEVVSSKLPEPIDLEMDDEAGVLYWTDRGELPLGNTLNKKTVGGPVPEAEKQLGRQILAQGLCEAIGLKLDKVNDCIFVADIGGHVWQCNRHRPAPKQKVYESETGAFTGLALTRV